MPRNHKAEIRKDYFLDKYVVITPKRAKRPRDIKEETIVEARVPCPFCRENIDKKLIVDWEGDKKNWKGWGERILDGVLTYEQHLEQKKSKHNPTWYADRLKKQEKLYEDYMKSLKEEKHWRIGGYDEIPKDSFSHFIRDAKLERDINYI